LFGVTFKLQFKPSLPRIGVDGRSAAQYSGDGMSVENGAWAYDRNKYGGGARTVSLWITGAPKIMVYLYNEMKIK
jgi:hypothetical protein